MRVIQGKKPRDKYYYDESNMTLSDKEGNTIKLYESLDGITDNLLQWYADILFHGLYKISNEFKDCCIVGKKDVFEWEELK